mmetsp:Transcript_24468/g.63786  ORF Transcript_24468/g.63786 Transcript_24468/m.63786 type:complete len:252 (-) Transcript_24468:164-919(-)
MLQPRSPAEARELRSDRVHPSLTVGFVGSLDKEGPGCDAVSEAYLEEGLAVLVSPGQVDRSLVLLHCLDHADTVERKHPRRSLPPHVVAGLEVEQRVLPEKKPPLLPVGRPKSGPAKSQFGEVPLFKEGGAPDLRGCISIIATVRGRRFRPEVGYPVVGWHSVDRRLSPSGPGSLSQRRRGHCWGHGRVGKLARWTATGARRCWNQQSSSRLHATPGQPLPQGPHTRTGTERRHSRPRPHSQRVFLGEEGA